MQLVPGADMEEADRHPSEIGGCAKPGASIGRGLEVNSLVGGWGTQLCGVDRLGHSDGDSSRRCEQVRNSQRAPGAL